MKKSNETTKCHGKQVPAWIIIRGHKMSFDRPALIDEDGGVPMDQMRSDECVVSPGAIYRKKSN